MIRQHQLVEENVTAYLKKLSCCLLDLNAGQAMLTTANMRA